MAATLLLAAFPDDCLAGGESGDAIVIDCASGPSREVILAGGGLAHFSCESHAENQRSYHGLCAGMHEFFDSWTFTAGRRAYRPADAQRAEVRPYSLTRFYDDGGRESVFLPRELSSLLIELTPAVSGPGVFTPWLEIRQIWEVPGPHYLLNYNERLGALFVEREGFVPPAGVPGVVCLLPEGSAGWLAAERREPRRYSRDEARKAMGSTNPWSPGRFEFPARAGQPLRIAIGLGGDAREAFDAARDLLDGRQRLLEEAEAHRAGLAASVPVSGDARFDLALRWARYSLDNLTMNARGPGIYAGYHWFTNYWGRDSFISLPGASLVHGDFDLARSILLSFAKYQMRDRESPRLGRMPNIVNPDDLQYAGVDGTWWWVRAARLYLDATGDESFLEAAWPAVRLAVDGAREKAVDDFGFLRHGDGETWMDAGGENNPFSPRGDRAIEVQVLWLDGLRTASRMAEALGEGSVSAEYAAFAAKLAKNLATEFWRGDGHGLADHLNTDGSRDLQIRPNQIFALTLPRWDYANGGGPAQLWDVLLAREILDTTLAFCVLPHGVTSLSPRDPAWIPRHLDLADHYYDEAYHNGDVWLWLSGPVMQTLCDWDDPDRAWEMMQPLIDDLLEHGAVGTMREIRDGEARSLEDFGGATSQAWSLAEFLRVAVEGFLGFHPRALDRELILRPRLPGALPALEGDVRWGGGRWRYRVGDGEASLTPIMSFAPTGSGERPDEEEWTVHMQPPVGPDQPRVTRPAAGESLRWTW